jgi:hypothetical protein
MISLESELGLIPMNNSPFDPLPRLSPLLWKLIPHYTICFHLNLALQFYFVIYIYNVYILHHRAHCHISYLHYTSLNLGLKTRMLQASPPTYQ